VRSDRRSDGSAGLERASFELIGYRIGLQPSFSI
jgi:hypothetical protein